MLASQESGSGGPADLAIDDDIGRGEPETFGDPHRCLVLWMYMCDEALHVLATEPRCHSHGSLASTSSALIPAGDHPRELCCQVGVITPQGRLNDAHGPPGRAVTYHPVQPALLAIW